MWQVQRSAGRGKRSALSLGQKTTLIALVLLLAGLSSVSGFTETAGDAAQGKQLFDRRCSGCHSMDQDKEGPRLKGVFGRQAGTVTSFKYSEALKRSHITWDTSTLDKWLADPDSVVADSDMDFHVQDSGERNAIIHFLQQSSGQ